MTCCVNYHLNIIWKATEKSKVCHFLFLVFGKVSSIRNERGFLSRTLGEKNAKERSLQTKQSRFRLCELSFRRSVTSLGAKSLSVCLSVRDRIIMSYLFPWQRLDFFQVHFSSTRKLYKLNKKNSFSDDGREIDHKVPSGMRLLLRYPISQRPGFQHSESWSFETECLR